VFCAAGMWVLVLVMVMSLCRVAKVGDQVMELACADSGTGPGGDQAMGVRTFEIEEAARALGIGEHTLVAWEARFGYPHSYSSRLGSRRLYRQSEVLALRDALDHGLSVSAAVSTARAAARRRRISA
jgi:hypothetical protein